MARNLQTVSSSIPSATVPTNHSRHPDSLLRSAAPLTSPPLPMLEPDDRDLTIGSQALSDNFNGGINDIDMGDDFWEQSDGSADGSDHGDQELEPNRRPGELVQFQALRQHPDVTNGTLLDADDANEESDEELMHIIPKAFQETSSVRMAYLQAVHGNIYGGMTVKSC
jgi:hypothetical protein